MLDSEWQTLSLWRRLRISQKPNVCALGRAGTFNAQTIKQAKQNELSQLESAEEGSCNSSACTSGLKFSLRCEQLHTWAGGKGWCVPLGDNHLWGFTQEKWNYFPGHAGNWRESTDAVNLCSFQNSASLLIFLLVSLFHPSLTCTHNQTLCQQRVRRLLRAFTCGGWTRWHGQV